MLNRAGLNIDNNNILTYCVLPLACTHIPAFCVHARAHRGKKSISSAAVVPYRVAVEVAGAVTGALPGTVCFGRERQRGGPGMDIDQWRGRVENVRSHLSRGGRGRGATG